MTQIYRWEREYRAALEETDPNKIPDAVIAAERCFYTESANFRNAQPAAP